MSCADPFPPHPSAAGDAQRAELALVLRRGLDWLLGLQRRILLGEEGGPITITDVTIEIGEVTRELVALGAAPFAADVMLAGFGFVLAG